METSISYIKLDPLLDGKSFRVIEPITYQTGGFQFVVPAGFITDFASMPLKMARWGKYGWAAILHDFLYSKDSKFNFSRKQADIFFLIFMKHRGTSAILAFLIFLAVRVFGRAFYKKS